MLIKKAKADGDIHGLQINEIMYPTHLLFFDDVLIFLDGSGQDSIQFEKILQSFCRATGRDNFKNPPKFIYIINGRIPMIHRKNGRRFY